MRSPPYNLSIWVCVGTEYFFYLIIFIYFLILFYCPLHLAPSQHSFRTDVPGISLSYDDKFNYVKVNRLEIFFLFSLFISSVATTSRQTLEWTTKNIKRRNNDHHYYLTNTTESSTTIVAQVSFIRDYNVKLCRFLFLLYSKAKGIHDGMCSYEWSVRCLN